MAPRILPNPFLRVSQGKADLPSLGVLGAFPKNFPGKLTGRQDLVNFWGWGGGGGSAIGEEAHEGDFDSGKDGRHHLSLNFWSAPPPLQFSSCVRSKPCLRGQQCPRDQRDLPIRQQALDKKWSYDHTQCADHPAQNHLRWFCRP